MAVKSTSYDVGVQLNLDILNMTENRTMTCNKMGDCKEDTCCNQVMLKAFILWNTNYIQLG